MANESPFSGGGVGSGVVMNEATKESRDALANLFNTKAAPHYLVDPDGAKMEMLFWPTGVVAIKVGDAEPVQFTYKKI